MRVTSADGAYVQELAKLHRANRKAYLLRGRGLVPPPVLPLQGAGRRFVREDKRGSRTSVSLLFFKNTSLWELQRRCIMLLGMIEI